MIGMPNMLDIAKLTGNDAAVGLIEENIQVHPEIRIMPARTIRGTAYKTLVRTNYPVASFRYANQGAKRGKSTFENRFVETFILDQQIAADKAVADAYEDGAPTYQAIEAVGVAEAALRRVCSSVYYGNSAAAVTAGLGDKKGFPGFIDMYDVSGHQIDAQGTTALTSVWGVKLGIRDVHLINGGNTVLTTLPQWRIQSIPDANGDMFTAYVNSLMGWIGMQVGSINSLVRIKNISGTDPGKGMTDALGQAAIELLPSGLTFDYFLMTKRSRRQLQNSRTPGGNNPVTANQVPTPTDVEGVPILVTDSISNNEGAL